jgi:uncharacterized protein (TIGR03437 family)
MRLLMVLFAIGSLAWPQTYPGISPHYVDIGSGGRSLALATDKNGEYYVISMITEPSGKPQIRATKTDAQGNTLATLDFGGSSPDTAAAAAVDAQGNLLIVGTALSSDFPVTSAPAPAPGVPAAYVVKLDGALTHIVASVLIGGNHFGFQNHSGTEARGVVIDRSGNVYIAGTTDALDFPITPGAFQTTPPGHDGFGTALDGFLVKLSPDLKQILFGTYFGGDETNCSGGSACLGAFGQTWINSLAVDAQGQAVIAGSTTASNLPVTPGSYATSCTCSHVISDGFLAKLNPTGSRLIWSTYFSREPSSSMNPLESNIWIQAMALDSGGAVVFGGSAPAGLPVTSGAVQGVFPGTAAGTPYAGFIAKLDPAARQLEFSSYFGSAVLLSGGVQSVAVDSANGVWVTGVSLASALPGLAGQPALGPTYAAGLISDGSVVSRIFTAPEGGAGQSITAGNEHAVAALGTAGSLLLSSSPASSLSVTGVAGSASDSVTPTIAPAELVSFYGYNLGPSTPLGAQVVNGVVTTSLGGFQVLFNDIPAPLLYVGFNQINCVVPSEIYNQAIATVQIRTPQGLFVGPALFITPSVPGIFHDSNGFGYALNQDLNINSASRPAAAGSIVAIWATGAGLRAGSSFPPDGTVISSDQVGHPALPVSIVSGGQSLEVLYAGDAPGLVFGATQVNFRLPDSFTVGTTSLQIQLQIGPSVSAVMLLYVKP